MSNFEAIATSAPLPALYVVLSNKSSKQNLGTYLRTASAFGATQVVVGA
jgi:tRNA G18 (ribose-2'-O)-methylase SpoU